MRERIECVIETVYYIKTKSTDGDDKADAGGQITTWTFLFHLHVFVKLLGLKGN